MKRTIIFLALLAILIGGCGANKDFVAEQLSASEARTAERLQALEDKTDLNSQELVKLQQLAAQLDERTEMALNEAKGFENYQIIWEGEINFDFDSYEIDETAAQYLGDAGDKMTNYPKSLAEIAGYTDATGSTDYNFFLGQKRSNSTKRYLAENYGISLYRMFVISHGEKKPIAMPDEKYAKSKNRRVKITVWGNL